MPVTVQVTSVIQKAVNGQKAIEAEGSSVGELIANIDEAYHGFKDQVSNGNGELHRFVNIYLNDEDIRFLGGKDTELHDGDVVSILPALAGG
jgi:molybdopterin synthase sulfur carrier subunit